MEDNTKELVAEIAALKKERNAVILAHNYVDGSIQDVADFTGDSLELSIRAQNAGAPMVVFCGVRFMAETAKILSPEATVLLPVPGAGCPMADMADAESVAQYKSEHPDTVLVAYVNSTAAVKAHVDICCTSANAEKVVRSIPADREIMFLPDQNLGANIAEKLHRPMHLWPGYCPTHHRIMPEQVAAARAAHPGVKVLLHPECPPATVHEADFALSTGGILRYVRESAESHFIIGTEKGILHRLKNENPGKTFYLLSDRLVCPNMKKIALEDVANSLRTLTHRVELDRELMDRARRPIKAMLELK